MLNILTRIFSPVDPEVLTALRYKMPADLYVSIHEDPSGKYVARLQDSAATTFRRPVVTEGATGQEVFEMVNDAVFTMLDIPRKYRDYMTTFVPPEEIREELKIKIPAKYLNKSFGLTKV